MHEVPRFPVKGLKLGFVEFLVNSDQFGYPRVFALWWLHSCGGLPWAYGFSDVSCTFGGPGNFVDSELLNHDLQAHPLQALSSRLRFATETPSWVLRLEVANPRCPRHSKRFEVVYLPQDLQDKVQSSVFFIVCFYFWLGTCKHQWQNKDCKTVGRHFLKMSWRVYWSSVNTSITSSLSDSWQQPKKNWWPWVELECPAKSTPRSTALVDPHPVSASGQQGKRMMEDRSVALGDFTERGFANVWTQSSDPGCPSFFTWFTTWFYNEWLSVFYSSDVLVEKLWASRRGFERQVLRRRVTEPCPRHRLRVHPKGEGWEISAAFQTIDVWGHCHCHHLFHFCSRTPFLCPSSF